VSTRLPENTEPVGAAQIVLASSSPRRRELLSQIGVRYVTLPVNIDESLRQNEKPPDYVSRMAAEKSLRGYELAGDSLPVLGADTIVVLHDRVLGKPASEGKAMEMLSRLSGQEHLVMSAVSLRGARHTQTVSVTQVCFREISEQEIRDYCATQEPLDKAGAYGIQGLAAVFVKQIQGSFSGVVGLPLYETSELLVAEGVSIGTLS